MIEGLLAASLITLIVVFLICSPLLILWIVASWKLFKKCGREGWEGIIPIYRDYVLIQITGIKWWAIFILVVGYFMITILPFLTNTPFFGADTRWPLRL